MTSVSESRDLLVSLHNLPDIYEQEKDFAARGFLIRRPLAPEKHVVLDWVRKQFWPTWESECDTAFGGHPIRCLIATHQEKIVGFLVYDSIALGTFGPMGIDETTRGARLGTVLFVRGLMEMRQAGYAYAIIGWAAPGPAEFVRKILPTQVIDNSPPERGMYRHMLKA